MKQIAEKHSNKPIIFYGAGEIYNHYKFMFKNCKPIAMLLDDEYIGDKKEIDSIPVFPVSKVNELDKECMIIAFSAIGAFLQRKLERIYSIPKERIQVISVLVSHDYDIYTDLNYI